MARTNLWNAAFQLVHQSPDHLSRNLWRRLFPVDLSDAAIGNRQLRQQCRVVRPDGFSLRTGNLSAGAAHCSLSDVGRHALCRDLLYAARANRTEVRHHRRAFARHVPGLRPAAGPRLVALFHLAAIQAHAAGRYWNSREDALRQDSPGQPAATQLLERGWQ